MISIVTSLYKSEQHLPSFLACVKKVHHELQKLEIPFEHLLIANDYSLEEKKLVNGSGIHFKILDVPRESIYASWNRGVQESTYQIFTSWNVDDIRFAEAFKRGLETIQQGYDATYFPFIYKRYIYLLGIKILVKRKVVMPPRFKREIFMKEMHAGPFFMVHKNIFSTIGFFDTSFKIAGDYDWWSRAANNGIKAERTDALAGIFSNDGKTLSGSKSNLQKEENFRVLKAL